MSRFLTITNSGSAHIGERKQAINKNQVKIGGVSISFLLVVLICLSGVFYIFEVNNLATKGYEIRELEKTVEKLKQDNERLKIQTAELKSMYNIEEKTKELNMVAPKDVSYINIPGPVALK